MKTSAQRMFHALDETQVIALQIQALVAVAIHADSFGGEVSRDHAASYLDVIGALARRQGELIAAATDTRRGTK